MSSGRNLWSSDDPIKRVDDDTFGRAAFAKHLADTITASAADSSIRIGLYGEWGEGKTSVMEMMQEILGGYDEDFVTLRVPTWAASTHGEALRLIVNALAEIADVEKSARVVAAGLSKAGAALGAVRSLARSGSWYTKLAENAVGDAASGLLASANDRALSRLLDDAMTKLGDRRAVLFLDDLDRTAPAVLPQLLMSIRELLSLPGLHTVMALSESAVSDALKKSGYGLESPELFLEKIVEYPAYLPSVSNQARRKYAEQCIESAGGLRHQGIFNEIEHLLPENPRRLKRYLRLLATLKRTFERFDDDELSWREAYLAQLLLAEFPLEARLLRQSEQAVKALRYSDVLDAMSSRQRSDARAKDRPEAKYAPADPSRAERFYEIVDALRVAGSGLGSFGLHQLLHLEDAPPVLTRREASRMLQSYIEAPAARREQLLSDVSSAHAPLNSDVLPHLWDYLLEFRTNAVERSFRDVRPSETSAAITLVNDINDLLRRLIDRGVFRDGLLGGTSWSSLRSNIAPWLPARATRKQAAEITAELSLIEDPTADAPHSFDLHVERILFSDRSLPAVLDFPNGYSDAMDRILTRVSERIAAHVLERLARPDAAAAIFDEVEGGTIQRLLLKPSSALYGPIFRPKFEALIKSAIGGEQVIQQNFLELLRIFVGAAQGKLNGLSSLSANDLLREHRLVTDFWRAACGGRLSEYAADRLIEIRGVLLEQFNLSPNDLPAASWWSTELSERASAQDSTAASVRQVAAQPAPTNGARGIP